MSAGGGQWELRIDPGEEYLDGIESRFTVLDENDVPVAYAFEEKQARLLTAAPALLDALRAMVEAFEPSLEPFDEAGAGAIADARAAIASAEGR